MAKEPKKSMPKIQRNSAGLRDALFDELDRMRNGETNATNANAIARLADQICNTVAMEIEIHKLSAKLPGTAFSGAALPGSVSLGAG